MMPRRAVPALGLSLFYGARQGMSIPRARALATAPRVACIIYPHATAWHGEATGGKPWLWLFAAVAPR